MPRIFPALFQRRPGRGVLPGAAVALAAPASAGDAGDVAVLPSGAEARFYELIEDIKPDGLHSYARFRFVVPGLGATALPDLETRAKDMDFLCSDFALPRLVQGAQAFDRISIALSERETEFGVSNPDVIQFFELYRIENGTCIWEGL